MLLVNCGLLISLPSMIDDAYLDTPRMRRFDRLGDLRQFILVDRNVERPPLIFRPLDEPGDLFEQSSAEPFTRRQRQLEVRFPVFGLCFSQLCV